MSNFNENTVELATLEWLAELGYQCIFGPDIAPGEPLAERNDYSEVLLLGRLESALQRLNPNASANALAEALRKISSPEHVTPMFNNRAFHQMLVNGLEVEVLVDGDVRGERIVLADFDNPDNNTWLAVNQYTITGSVERRPDVVVFLNGLPVAVIELKNAADDQATIEKAYQQLQTYQMQLPRLFVYNELLVISDGSKARLGCVGAELERFLPLKTVSGEEVLPESLDTLLKGVFEKKRLLEFIKHFVVFEDSGTAVTKKIAAYHQFHAVQKAVAKTLEAMVTDRKGGVIWHTQGSGKSLTMVFFARKLILEPEMHNPTIVLITDRNDLDEQLFSTFARCSSLLRQTPVQAESRASLHDLLNVASGGVVFSTIQKFLPEEKGERFPTLSERTNVIVIADEAHRTQYGFEGKLDKEGRVNYGFAKHLRDALPNATYVGFTGTPVEFGDVRNTRDVFGEYIDIYDVQRAVEDGATVPIYYESRLAKLDLGESDKPKLDEDFEDITEDEEISDREKLKSTWARLEALVGTPKRLEQVAQDLVGHFEKRQKVLFGKGMIVCMSRRICVELYEEIIKLRPGWQSDKNTEGVLKVVMTGSASDPSEWQHHLRDKRGREAVSNYFKDAGSAMKLVIVRDMWLTGFDVPSLHTMYLDKPIKGHGLMQAIARVNRVFGNKPGGLVVDYLGVANNLREALQTYKRSGGQGDPAETQEQAVTVMDEKLGIARGLFHGFDYTDFLEGSPKDRVALIAPAQEHILAQRNGKERFLKVALELDKAFALAMPHDEAVKVEREVIFFQTIRAALGKSEERVPGQAKEDLHHAIQQLVDNAIAPRGVIDIFAAAGLQKPDISILSDGFLAEVRDMPYKNLAVDLLQKLLNDELKTSAKKNLVQSRKFSEKLAEAINKYQNRSVETAQIIEELIAMAKSYSEAQREGETLGLTDDELAFYNALEVDDDAVKIMGNEALCSIARELAKTVRENATIDWTVREQVRANLRRMVKRVLRKYGYPPTKQDEATQTVLEQARMSAEAAV